MKKILLAISAIILLNVSFSQTNISGIINSYAAVTNIQVQACVSNTFTVDDASAFNVGDTVLIIQMQGAEIDITNTANFGNITDIGNAGNYEKNYISAVSGNDITFGFELNNTYDVAGKVQLVNIPHYIGNVNINSVLTAMAWNGNKGGVLAFTCSGDVSMTANIDVRGLGFRGGGIILAPTAGVNQSCGFGGLGTDGCVGVDYFYDNTSVYAVDKGEGIVILNTNYQRGKGKNANGGGGGGIEAGGGGGGANIGNGGYGGGCNEKSCPTTFGCSCNASVVAGLGAIGSVYSNKIFLGGGSGAGNNGNGNQYWNTPYCLGLNGGGIVYIKANQIIGNNNTIIAKGVDGVDLSASSTGTMGTAGGGGGGSILIEADNVLSTTINTEGGRGNDSRKTSGSSNATGGSGGGGGGGLVAYSGGSFSGTVTTTITGGIAGNSYDREGDLRNAPYKGTDGSVGTISYNYVLPFSNTPFSIATALSGGTLHTPIAACTGDSVYFSFTTNPTNGQSYIWQVDSSGTWEYLSNNAIFVNTATQNMSITAVTNNMSTHQYRLMVYNTCDSIYSNLAALNIGASPTINVQPADYATCPSSNALFYASATNVNSFQWQLFDGTNWNNLSNNATYTGVNNDSLIINNVTVGFNGNLYRVVLTNSCTSVNSTTAELIIDNQTIVPNAMIDTIKVCTGADTVFVANYTGLVDSVQWQVDEGSGFINLINTSNYLGVHNDSLFVSNTSQSFDGYLYRALLFNNCGNNAISDTIVLSVFDAPSVSVPPLTNACQGQGVFVSISNVTGSNITYQWQIDTTGTWQNLGDSLGYSNTTNSFLGFSSSITHPSINTDNYRVQITTDCGTAVSNTFRLNISAAPQITAQPINDSVCLGDSAIFYIQGNNIDSFQWQNNQSGTYTNLSNGVKFSGVHNDTITINNIQTTDLGVMYRVRLYGVNHSCANVTSSTAQIYLLDTVQITQQAADETICAGNAVSFAIGANNATAYQWQVNTGSGFANLSNNATYAGVATDSLHLNNVPQSFSGYIYRCIVSNNCNADTTNEYTLTVNSTQTYNQNVVLCYGDTLFLTNGNAVSNTGTFNDTIANGLCDSVIIYNVTAIPLIADTILEQLCSGNTFTSPNGNTISNNGYVTDTFTTAQCDSFVTYNVSLLPIFADTSLVNICSNDSILLQNGTYATTTGMYIDTFANATPQSCDSFHYINLTVFNPYFDTINQNICDGDTFISPNGQQLTANGSVTDTITAAVCDSFITYNILVQPLNFDTVFATICSNESYTLPSGTVVNTANIYTDTIAVFNACDSVITTNLTVVPTSSSNYTDTICTTNESYTLPSGTVVNGQGIYFDTIPNANLCDSFITVNLNYVPNINNTTIFRTFCNGESYTLPSGAVVSTSGTYNDTITTPQMCDSIMTFNITEEEPLLITNQSTNVEVCEGESHTLFVIASGVNIQYQWQENGVNMAGQTVSSLTLNNIDATIASNTYSVVVYNNCDTLQSQPISISLYAPATVVSQSNNIEQCGGFSFMLYVQTNNVIAYQWQINEGNGFVNLNNGSLNGSATQIFGADNDTLIVSNFDTSISGAVFNVLLTTQCGEALNFNPVSVVVTEPVALNNTQNDTTICSHEIEPMTVPYVSNSAVWSNGDFGQTFTPTTTGNYTVQFTDANNCPNTDEIYIEIEDCLAACNIFMPTGFSPNNSGVNDVLKAIYNCEIDFFEFTIYNRYGEKVFFTNDFTIGWDGTYRGKNAELGTYSWFIEYKFTHKTIKESLKGSITLIR